jgi:hypothetical protein
MQRFTTSIAIGSLKVKQIKLGDFELLQRWIFRLKYSELWYRLVIPTFRRDKFRVGDAHLQDYTESQTTTFSTCIKLLSQGLPCHHTVKIVGVEMQPPELLSSVYLHAKAVLLPRWYGMVGRSVTEPQCRSEYGAPFLQSNFGHPPRSQPWAHQIQALALSRRMLQYRLWI